MSGRYVGWAVLVAAFAMAVPASAEDMNADEARRFNGQVQQPSLRRVLPGFGPHGIRRENDVRNAAVIDDQPEPRPLSDDGIRID